MCFSQPKLPVSEPVKIRCSSSSRICPSSFHRRGTSQLLRSVTAMMLRPNESDDKNESKVPDRINQGMSSESAGEGVLEPKIDPIVPPVAEASVAVIGVQTTNETAKRSKPKTKLARHERTGVKRKSMKDAVSKSNVAAVPAPVDTLSQPRGGDRRAPSGGATNTGKHNIVQDI
jgi:hypothetical protein